MKLLQTVTFCTLLTRSTIPCACHEKLHMKRQKWSEHVVILTCSLGNVLRATTACTFSTSQLLKSAPRMVCIVQFDLENVLRATTACTFSTSQLQKVLRSFVHFDFEICFAPQRRALFPDLHFQKWFECDVFLAFSLANVLRATTACNVSSLRWPHGSAPAALVSLLFDPPEPQTIGKNKVNRDFLTFSCTCTFFLLTLSPL